MPTFAAQSAAESFLTTREGRLQLLAMLPARLGVLQEQ